MGSSQLKLALGYKRFTGSPRVLVFKPRYLVVGDILDGAAQLGWATHTIEIKSKGSGESEFIARLLTDLVAFKPDFIIVVNHFGFDEEGILSGLLEQFEIPLASWFVDHPMPILGGADKNATSNCQVFCFERTALRWLAGHGYENPVYLPTGSNRRLFHPNALNSKRVAEFKCALSFAANSWWIKARLEPEAHVKDAVQMLTRKNKIDRNTVASGMESIINSITGVEAKSAFAVVQVALAEASMQTRVKFVEALMPLGVKVYGDSHWNALVPGVNLNPYVDYETSLPALFAASSINTNITAEQMPTAVNQRVWDVPGTGAFLLTDAQKDVLENFKDGEDVATFKTVEEAAEKATYYLKNPIKRKAIATRGFAQIESKHRITHRLTKMLKIMKQRFT